MISLAIKWKNIVAILKSNFKWKFFLFLSILIRLSSHFLFAFAWKKIHSRNEMKKERRSYSSDVDRRGVYDSFLQWHWNSLQTFQDTTILHSHFRWIWISNYLKDHSVNSIWNIIFSLSLISPQNLTRARLATRCDEALAVMTEKSVSSFLACSSSS